MGDKVKLHAYISAEVAKELNRRLSEKAAQGANLHGAKSDLIDESLSKGLGLTSDMDPDLFDELKQLAKKEHKPLSALLDEAVRDLLEKRTQKHLRWIAENIPLEEKEGEEK